MPITPTTTTLDVIQTARQIAEEALAEAKEAVDTLRVAEVRQLLAQTFPSHTMAVFTRDLNENGYDIRLLQLLTTRESCEDIDLSDGTTETFSNLEWAVVHNAADTLSRIGDDQTLHDLLDAFEPGEYEKYHEDWVEFDLELGLAAITADDIDNVDAEPTEAQE